MARNLEEFLQQAAQRLAEKVKQSEGQARRAPPRTTSQARSVRQAERAPVEPEIVEAELLDEVGPNPLSNLDTRYQNQPTRGDRNRPSRGVDQADERMTDRLHQALDHNVVQLRGASSALGGKSQGVAHSGNTSVTRRNRGVSSLVLMLRNPETLRAAFIAGEIFNRRP